MPPRPAPGPASAGSDGGEAAVRRKLADLVARKRYSEAIRVRGQALLRRPELDLRPSESQLWCLEGRQAAEQGQAKRAEAAFRKAMVPGQEGEPLERLARLWVDQGQIPRALALLEEAFAANRLPKAHAGAYLKVLLLAGETERARNLVRNQPKRFQGHQLHWVAGVLHLLEGDPASARRQFAVMAGPATMGDHGSVWRAWASLEMGDPKAAADDLDPPVHPAMVAVALDLAARTGQPPGELVNLSRRDLPRREEALALTLLHHLRQNNHLSAGQLLLANERTLLASLPELVSLRRPLLVLAGQQAVERESPEDAIACWRPIVDRPAFDPELALRLYPLLDAEDDGRHTPECERLVSQLLAWLRRTARANPSAWPEPLLSSTVARLHCWQVDQTIKLGEGQRALRALGEAERLAPDLPDVIGRRGLIAYMKDDNEAATALLWDALEGGCQALHLYEILEELLETAGQQSEVARLRRVHGPRFGALPALEAESMVGVPAWLEALSHATLREMAVALRNSSEPGAGLDALRVLLEHVSPPAGAATGKVPLALPGASDRWDALLAALSPADQVEALTAILVAIRRFCRRTGKPITSEVARRQAQLEAHAARTDTPQGEAALRALLLLHGLGLKASEEPGTEAARLLRRARQPQRTLPMALFDLRLFASTKPWRAVVDDLRRQDPDNPLLTLALATMERNGSFAHGQRHGEAFDQARRQQDGVALAACNRELWWADRHPAKSIGRPSRLMGGLEWDRLVDMLDIEALVRQIVREKGGGELSEEQLQKIMPLIQPELRQVLADAWKQL
ncbi:MAG: tetratricopeptide repeat protein [Cyanobacteriota bacterium]